MRKMLKKDKDKDINDAKPEGDINFNNNEPKEVVKEDKKDEENTNNNIHY